MKSEVRGGSVLLRQQQRAVKLLGRQAPLQRGGCGTAATLLPSPVVSAAHRQESAGWGTAPCPRRCDPLCLPTKCSVQLKFNVLMRPSPIHLTVPDTCPARPGPHCTARGHYSTHQDLVRDVRTLSTSSVLQAASRGHLCALPLAWSFCPGNEELPPRWKRCAERTGQGLSFGARDCPPRGWALDPHLPILLVNRSGTAGSKGRFVPSGLTGEWGGAEDHGGTSRCLLGGGMKWEQLRAWDD